MMNKIKLTKEEYCILDTIKLFNKFQKIYILSGILHVI